MTRSPRCPPLRARGGHLFSGLLLVVLAAAPARLPAQNEPYRDYFLLGLGWGWALPLAPGYGSIAGVEGIEPGPQLDDLIRAIVVHRTVAERLAVDIDHDSTRLEEGELFGGENVYSLSWVGQDDEALRAISIGNLQRTVDGSRYIPLDAGSSESLALKAEARLGPVTLEGLARYGSAIEGRKRFRGSRSSVETDLADVAYARGRFFLLPDAGIDEAGLRVAKSSATGTTLIDGRRYALLARGSDWNLDNAGARLTLTRALASGEELAVTYTKSGLRVGDSGLGDQAIIREDGSRDDFDAAGWSGYFGDDTGSTPWLFLKREGLNSYWELRTTFYLEDLEEGLVPEQVAVQFLHTATLAPNPAYDALADGFRISLADATISFEFADSTGRFYPRPFPGEGPFGTLPVGPANNPFDPENPIYGGVSYAPLEASITTARVRYLLSTDTYRLDLGLVVDSVRVTVDGKPLASSSWTVDPILGTITFAPGVIGPQSDVEVVYRWTPFAGAGREFVAAVGAGIGDETLGGRNLLALTLPIPDAPAPRLGEANRARLADSLDANATFGATPGERGFTASVSGATALALTSADLSGVTIIADMEDDRRIGIGLSEGAWALSTPSTLLPVTLEHRGDLRYENLWEELALGGSVLHGVSWDNSGNAQFTYAEKAGPYNSADPPPGSTVSSLVLDVAFPAGSSNPWAAASTVVSGIDVSGLQRLSVWLRGIGVTGDPGQALRVYAEALGDMSEDLDGDGALDGETSSTDEGFAITPERGGPTVLGTDRLGRSNGRLDSEDRNGDGVLDDPAEVGVVLSDSGDCLASFAAGTSDSGWIEVPIDVASLADPDKVLRNIRGIRLTVASVADPVTSPAAGRILVGGFAFSGSSFTSSSASLSVREVTPAEDADLADHPFAVAYPAVYEELHGSEGYREDHGVADKSLACDIAGLAADERAMATLPVAPPADLSAWKLLKLYVLVPDAGLLATDASFVVGMASGSDNLEAAVPAASSGFQVGWNEIAVLLEYPWTVTVNGAPAGSLSGKAGVIRRASAVRIGLAAGPSGIATPCRFLTDEWHLARARLALEGAARLDASAGWRGDLAAVGGLPLVSDPFLSADYEHRTGAFLGPYGRTEDRWRAGLDARLLDSLSVSFTAGQAYDRPTEPDAEVMTGLENGTIDLRTLRLVLDTGIAWVPEIEHRWDRSRAVERDPVLATTGPLVQIVAASADRETVSLSERLEHEIGLAQWVSYSRTWTRDAHDRLDATDGSMLSTIGSRGLVEAGHAGLSWTGNDGKVTLQATRDRIYDAPDSSDSADGAWSYAYRLADLFAAPADALLGASVRTLRDRVALDIGVPRVRHLGISLAVEAAYTELNVDPATGSRDVTARDAVSLSLPVSPDGEGRIQLVPEVSAVFTGSYRAVDRAIGEPRLLFAPWPGLLLVPLTWSRTLEHEAAGPFVGIDGVESATNGVAGRLALTAKIADPAWYLPSRASVALKDDTGRRDAARTQKRAISVAIGKDAMFSEARTLAGDADASYTTDFAAKVRSLSLSVRTSARLPGLGWGSLSIDQSTSWTRDRQAIDDPRLSLLPGIPDDPATVVAHRPDQDTLRNSLAIAYAWSRAGAAYGADVEVQRTTHTERLSLESLATWVEPGVVSSSVPIRASFAHATEIDVSPTFTLGLSGTVAAGVERRTGPGEVLLLPSIGFQVGVTGKLRF